MNMISGLYNTERVTLTVLKMRKDGLSGSGPVDIHLLRDVFASKLHFLLLFSIQGTFPSYLESFDRTARQFKSKSKTPYFEVDDDSLRLFSKFDDYRERIEKAMKCYEELQNAPAEKQAQNAFLVGLLL